MPIEKPNKFVVYVEKEKWGRVLFSELFNNSVFEQSNVEVKYLDGNNISFLDGRADEYIFYLDEQSIVFNENITFNVSFTSVDKILEISKLLSSMYSSGLNNLFFDEFNSFNGKHFYPKEVMLYCQIFGIEFSIEKNRIVFAEDEIALSA